MPLAFLLIPYTIYKWGQREEFVKILIGFFYILILSDSRVYKFTSPIYVSMPFDFAAKIKSIYLILMFLLLLLNRDKFKPFSHLFKWFIPFFIVSLISFFWFPEEKGKISFMDGFLRWFSYLMLLFVVPNYVVKGYRDQGIEFFRKIIFFSVLILVIGFLLRFVNHDVAYLKGRFRGMFGNPNGIGIYCTVLFGVAAIINHHFKEVFSQRQKIAILGIIFVMIVYSGSRTALVSVGMFFLLARFAKTSPWFAVLMAIVIGMITPVLLANLSSFLQAVGLQETMREDTLENGSGRFVVWNFAWDKIQDFYFLGRGFAYDLYVTTFKENEEWLSRQGHQGGVHNTYLSIWLNTGLVGVVLFFRAFLLLFFKAAKLSRLAFPFLASILFSITFESWLVASLNPFTSLLLVGLTILVELPYADASNKDLILDNAEELESKLETE